MAFDGNVFNMTATSFPTSLDFTEPYCGEDVSSALENYPSAVLQSVFGKRRIGFLVSSDVPSLEETEQDQDVYPELLQTHDSTDSCWVAMQGGVYDLTDYAPEHPGGDFLYRFCGTDATENFLVHHNSSTFQIPGGPPYIGQFVITPKELLTHNSTDDCWVAMVGGVYDLTTYPPDHPGGDFLYKFCGADATDSFLVHHNSSTFEIPGGPPFVGRFFEEHSSSTTGATPATTQVPTTAATQVPTNEPTESPTNAPERTVGLIELSEHDDPDTDCWLVIYGTVYDLTDYATQHPGGASNITDYCGADGTAAYADVHTVANLNYARSFIVGSYSEPEETLVPTLTPTFSEIIAIDELVEHNTMEDCWMALLGGVYDLTYFAVDHPGGEDTIFQYCGMEASEPFGFHHNITILETKGASFYKGRFLLTEIATPTWTPVSDAPSH